MLILKLYYYAAMPSYLVGAQNKQYAFQHHQHIHQAPQEANFPLAPV